MKKPTATPASKLIDEKIRKLKDWRGDVLSRVRRIILGADSGVVEEMKWVNTPLWSHHGAICTGETYKDSVKLTFPRGAALPDPLGLFNSSLEGKVRRAVDFHEGDSIDEAALRQMVSEAIGLNLKLTAEKEARKKAKQAQ